MKKISTELERTYDSCLINGNIQHTEPRLEDANELIQKTKEIKQEITTEKTKNPTQQFLKYYEALMNVINALLASKGDDVKGEQCKNAYITIKYPALELSYDFLENARIKQELLQEEKQEIKKDEWMMMKLNFELHISAMIKELENQKQI